jgi:hypothetical protein
MSKPFSDRCSNTGHYTTPRWTCCACYAELGNIGKGEHKCACGATIDCGIDYEPSYITTLVDDGSATEGSSK